MQRKNTLLEEPVLIQGKIVSPEVQHIISILKNCISQVEAAASLSELLQSNAVPTTSEELNWLLQKHQMLAEKVEAIEDHIQEPCEEQGDEADETKRREKTQLNKDTKNSIRDVLRFFRDLPNVTFSFKFKLSRRISNSEEIRLIKNLKLFLSHMLERLLTSPDDNPVSDDQTLSSLEEELKRIIQEEKDVIAARELRRRNRELQALEEARRGIDGPDSPVAFVEKQIQLLLQAHNQKQNSKQQEMDQLNAKLHKLMLENRQTERTIQEKNEKVEMEIEYLLQVFDNEMDELQTNLESNLEIYEQEQEEVNKLQEPFSTIEKEYVQILEKRDLAEEKRQKELRELELKTKAALYAQSWWRGHTTRKALKNKKKKKKGKKGKSRKT